MKEKNDRSCHVLKLARNTALVGEFAEKQIKTYGIPAGEKHRT